MAPNPKVKVYTTPPEALLDPLATTPHFPYALPLARRLQFTKFPGGITEHARILWASEVSLERHLCAAAVGRSDGGGVGGGSEEEKEGGKKGGRERETPFAAAYLDFSRGPETELWIYSSMEARAREGHAAKDAEGKSQDQQEKEGWKEGEKEEEEEEEEEEETACAIALLREVKKLQDLYFTPGSARAEERDHPDVLVGNLNEVVRERLAKVGLDIVSTGLYDKFIFRVDALPDVGVPEVLEGGKRLIWDKLRLEDIPFAISRSSIQRTERTVKLLSSTALYLDDGTPIAWAFLGPDSSLNGLHCEVPYRGRGLAKAVAVKVLRDHLKDFSDDGHGWADVAPDNLQSQGEPFELGSELSR
ncbi:hypothetical protein F4808DRAFT_461259 [Astrocystis sublimbata]|nr:hypothetical protein F4808DRAFT_461259 [Astrocystis sublimbata]